VLVRAATETDCRALAETSKRAFDHDVNYGADGPGGPPGYDSVAWHRRAMSWGRVFALVEGARVVGGAIVIPKSGDWAELGRVWLVPEAQNQGWGRLAMARLEALHPDIARWTLETPVWNKRTQHFYEAFGYREVERTTDDVRYERLRAERP
jgi:GNAT superfamily N-acetyltransferase